MKRTSLAILAALVCMSAASADGQASGQQTGASSPSDQLYRFVGDGTCTGQNMAMGKDPGHVTTGKFHGEKTLDGHWVVIRYDQDRTAAIPKPYHVAQYIGYDAVKKQFIAVTFDNSGGPYAMGTSQGWKGGTIEFDETAPGAEIPSFRDIFTNGDSGVATHTGMMQDKNGQWVKTDEETCHKA